MNVAERGSVAMDHLNALVPRYVPGVNYMVNLSMIFLTYSLIIL